MLSSPLFGRMLRLRPLIVPLLLLVAIPASADRPGLASQWSVARSVDAMFDTPTIVAVLPGLLALPSSSLGSDAVGPALRLACAAGVLRVGLSLASPATSPSALSSSTVMLVRFDDMPPQWVRLERFESDLRASPARFLAQLRSHVTLALRVDPLGTSPLTVLFDLTQAAPVVDEVLDACRRAEGADARLASCARRSEAR